VAINAGIRRIVCREDYPDDLGKSLLKQGGVHLEIFAPAKK
jgi:deoxycytidylate deaminase